MSNANKKAKKGFIVAVVIFVACLILIFLPSSVFEKKSDTIPTLSGGATVENTESGGILNKTYSPVEEPTTAVLTTAEDYTLSPEVKRAIQEKGTVEVPDEMTDFISNLDPARIDMSWVKELDEARIDINYPLNYGEKNGFIGLVDVINKDYDSTSPKWAGIFDAVYLGYVGGTNKGFAAYSIDLSAGLSEGIIILRTNQSSSYSVGNRVNISFTTNNARLLTVDGNRLIVGE